MKKSKPTIATTNDNVTRVDMRPYKTSANELADLFTRKEEPNVNSR